MYTLKSNIECIPKQEWDNEFKFVESQLENDL